MRVLFAGGGTGGHINPAISIADYAASKDKDFEVLFVGTKAGLETKLVPDAGYNIEYIEIQGLDRKHLLKNIETVKKLIAARRKCRKIIKDFKPDCVVCTGGYVSGPVAMASKTMKVPSLIHEQNVYPGMTVKYSANYVTYLALSFEETINHMRHKEKCVVTGNPIREEILKADYNEARKNLGVKKPFVLIFGGSLGADRINDTVIDMLGRISKENKIELLFGTGDRNYEKIMNTVKEKGITVGDNVKIVSYINNMAECMAAADVVVSRAGAITVSEIAALNKPSILIPSPNVVRNHQEQNAREFESKNAAALILEKDLNSEALYDKIMSMVNDKELLGKMSENLKSLAKTDALEKIYNLMIKMADKGENR